MHASINGDRQQWGGDHRLPHGQGRSGDVVVMVDQVM